MVQMYSVYMMTDNFAGTSLNTNLWDKYGTAVSVNNGIIITASSSSGVGIISLSSIWHNIGCCGCARSAGRAYIMEEKGVRPTSSFESSFELVFSFAPIGI